MKPGSAKRVTLAQVAEAAGVSVMTASYTYNQPSRVSDDARSKVLVAAGQLGYAGPDPSAQSLRRGSTSTLGVVLGEHLSYAFQDPQAASFLAGIADVCADHGFGMTILPITGAADDAARIQASAVDGFVIWTTSDDDPILKAVQTTRRPAVVHGGPAVRGLGLVSINNQAAARAVGVVAFAGAARPAVISFPLSRDRIGTIARGPETKDIGIPWKDVLVAVCARNDADEAQRLAATLLSSPERPDAIAAMSDEQAAGITRAARAAGLAIPDDIALTGWDNAAVASQLGLTTVAQSMREQGAACARAALGQEPQSLVASWSLIRRASTHP